MPKGPFSNATILPGSESSKDAWRSAGIRERTSIDTLADRLGLLEIKNKSRRKKTEEQEKPQNRPRPQKRKSNPKPTSSLCCCIGAAEENIRAPRPIKSNGGNNRQRRSTMPVNTQRKEQRPEIARDPSSRTGEFLSLIPPSASPQTTGLLLAELAKPFSELDDEGFIYMFWLTPETLPADAPSEAASSLLAPPGRVPPGHRRTLDVLNTFAFTAPNIPNKKTMLLKIGRAQNVQRRLNQWTRQCGYNLSLIRYYPYHPTASSSNVNQPPRTPRKVPNVNRVERLIHIELAGKKLQGGGKCGVCGRGHREWFEVDASRDGVKAVDEVIRRWTDWGERQVPR
ncbi:hypothetical protein LSUE1_G005661 [Lachnellula suecica]|uniref:Bacteriophage T5 Orf172 DNA-binding domain-containing protein n=1 Tax=Lachnellula suecica TaxID=602035 RepID=A0A8T9CAT2_9HELO|nr:hypothetical protein LSUE1_G005661 [Lachnellula suecica]